MVDLLALYLKPHHYLCYKAYGAKEALSAIRVETFDIILLDIMMPEMNGWKLCKELRRFSGVPIIMVTARDQKEDIVKGLKLGADDYITKPINEEELLARMDALLRRIKPSSHINVQGLIWNEDRFELTYKNNPIKLTPKEFFMVGHLMKKSESCFH